MRKWVTFNVTAFIPRDYLLDLFFFLENLILETDSFMIKFSTNYNQKRP